MRCGWQTSKWDRNMAPRVNSSTPPTRLSPEPASQVGVLCKDAAQWAVHQLSWFPSNPRLIHLSLW